jgi:hypothetical protein
LSNLRERPSDLGDRTAAPNDIGGDRIIQGDGQCRALIAAGFVLAIVASPAERRAILQGEAP